MGEETRAAIYVRVSTNEQSTDAQESELKKYAQGRGWAVCKVYRDQGQSGAKVNRPGLAELMTDCKRRKVDVVLVWKFDRFARSVRQLLDALEEFNQRGIDFVSFMDQIDTSTSSGKFCFTVIAAVAELERAIITERVKAGLVQAQHKGKRLGRPPNRKLTPDEIKQLRNEKDNHGLSLRKLAHKYGITLWMTHRLCRGRKAVV